MGTFLSPAVKSIYWKLCCTKIKLYLSDIAEINNPATNCSTPLATYFVAAGHECWQYQSFPAADGATNKVDEVSLIHPTRAENSQIL